jgi:hypothetical protein
MSEMQMQKELERRLTLHDRYYGMLLDKVREDRYPSSQMLDMLEKGMVGHEREELVDVLLEKVEADRYPSIDMLRRIARIASLGGGRNATG